MTRFRYSCIILLLFAFQQKAVLAQEQFDAILEQSISSVNSLLDSSNVFLIRSTRMQQEAAIPGFLFLSGDLISQKNAEQTERFYQLKEKYLKSDLGLRISGNYNNNLSGGFAEDEDIFYRQRTYVGMEWNIMETGSIGNKRKINALDTEKQKRFLDLKQQNRKNSYLFNQQYIIVSFAQAQNPYLKQRLNVLQGLMDIYQDLFYLKRMDWETLLKIKGEIKKVELSLARNRQLIDQSGFMEDELLQVADFPVYGLNPRQLFKLNSVAKNDSLQMALSISNLENNYEPYISKINARPYIRYNFYDFLSYNARSYPSVGVSINVPLHKNSGKNDLVQVEKELLEASFDQGKDETMSEIMLLARNYENHIRDFVYLNYQRDLLKEKISRELRKREINLLGFNGIKALGFFDEFLSYQAAILDKKKDVYLQLLDICFVAECENPNRFLTDLGYDLALKNFPGNKAVYVWSDLFNVLDNNHLFSFLHDREIGSILLSMGQATDSLKLRAFFLEAEKENIHALGLIANNELVTHSEERVLQYLDRFKGFRCKGIHLDVEPHVFDDFYKDEKAYLEKLMRLYELSAVWAKQNGFTLSASVPFHYPDTFIQKALNVCNKLYIMNYGAKNKEQFAARMKVVIGKNNPENLVMSLRPSDFSSLAEMDYAILYLLKETGVKSFSYSDLRGLNVMPESFVAEESDSPHYKQYRVEIGTFGSEKDAAELSEKVKKTGYNGQVAWKRNGTYCVVIGYFNTFDSARNVHEKFKDKWPELPQPWVYMVH